MSIDFTASMVMLQKKLPCCKLIFKFQKVGKNINILSNEIQGILLDLLPALQLELLLGHLQIDLEEKDFV